MSSSPHPAVVVPFNLGDASRVNRAIFPLSYQKRDSLGQGDLYLDATLDEMLKITNIGSNPKQFKEIITTMRAKYDELLEVKEALENRPKTRNPLKVLENYRAARMFLAASKSLYVATRSRSEEVMRTIGRGLLSTMREEEVESVDSDPLPGTNITAIAVKVDRPLDDASRQQIMDAANAINSYSGQYEDEASSILSREYFLASESLSSLVISEESEDTLDTTDTPTPLSPTIINNYTFIGSVYSPNSNVHGLTVQVGGSKNSGSVTHTVTPPN